MKTAPSAPVVAKNSKPKNSKPAALTPILTPTLIVSLALVSLTACGPVEFAKDSTPTSKSSARLPNMSQPNSDDPDNTDSDPNLDPDSSTPADPAETVPRGGLTTKYGLKDFDILYLYQQVTPRITQSWQKVLVSSTDPNVADPANERCERSLEQHVAQIEQYLNRDIELQECKPFLVARALRQAKGGQCQAQSRVLQSASIAGVIGDQISIEVNEDCLCYKKYASHVAAVISQEVWVVAPQDECAKTSNDYAENLISPVLAEISTTYGL